LQLLRVIFSTLEGSLFFWALTELPLAEVMTYYMAGPIYVTALSPVLLGERVGWRRWTAVTIGFGGVVLALQPSASSLSLGAVCALVGSFSYACFMVATRNLDTSRNLSP
jgi:S-adenosylmethionine uptake transporter